MAWASEEPAHPLIKNWAEFFPLLFDTCAVLTVKDARVQVDSHTPHSHILILTAHIDQVLTGDLGKSKNIDFVFDQSYEKIFADTPCADLRGKTIVLAFRQISFKALSIQFGLKSSLPIVEIWSVFAPFPNQKFSQSDLNGLRRSPPPEIYPCKDCLELRIKQIEDRSDAKGDRYPMTATVTGQILTVLRNNSHDVGPSEKALPNDNRESNREVNFKKGELFRFLFTADQWDKVFKGKTARELIGTKCVVSFDCGEKGIGDAYRILAPGGPFPEQKYSAAEVKELTAKFKVSSAYLKQMKSDLQKYIECRWSKERIKQFCQPQTRLLPHVPDFLQDSQEGTLKGRLYPETEQELGKVSWSCNIEAGMPVGYEVDVDRGKHQFWILEIACPSILSFTDTDLTKNILAQKLRNGWLTFVFLQSKTKRVNGNELSTGGPVSLTKLIRNDKGLITGFEASLQRDQTLTADSSDHLDISNVLVDGKPNAFWNDICAQESQNMDKLFQDSH
jgi:hypothetical protein